MPNSETPKPEAWPNHGPTYRDWVDYVLVNSSHAKQVLTPGGWSEWDAGRYARQQYEEMRAELAALREQVKVVEAEATTLRAGFDRVVGECVKSNESLKAASQYISDLTAERDALRAEVERLREKNSELNRREQAATRAAKEAKQCLDEMAAGTEKGTPWCSGSLGRGLLAWENSQLKERLTKARDAALEKAATAAWDAIGNKWPDGSMHDAQEVANTAILSLKGTQ